MMTLYGNFMNPYDNFDDFLTVRVIKVLKVTTDAKVVELCAQMQTLREKIKLITSDQSQAGAEKFSEGISSYECLKAQKLEMEKKLEAEKLRKEQLEEALRLSNLEKKFLVRCSYVEIYNEEIRDLLGKDPN